MAFCCARGLDPRLITSLFRLYDPSDYGGCIGMPVFDAAGLLLYHRIRTQGGRILREPAGGEYTLYGIHLLSRDYGKRPILIVEGQSDTWALAQHGWPAVGVVGWGQAQRASVRRPPTRGRPGYARRRLYGRQTAAHDPARPSAPLRAVNAIKRGMPVHLVAAQLGHKDATLVQRIYGKFAPKRPIFGNS